VRFVAAWARGVPRAAAHAAGLLLLVAMAANDLLAAFGAVALPRVSDFGFAVPVATIGWALTTRFAEDARALQALRLELQHEVAQRTAQLGETQDQLHRAERLAAIGEFAAGVAHEVSNPSAVVSANLRCLAEEARSGGPLSEDARDAIDESLVAIERISTIVRQLLDASQLAATPVAAGAVALRPAVEEALRTARARCGGRVTFLAEVPEQLRACASEGMVVQVLGNLVVNAAQAIPAERLDGFVRVVAEEGGRGVRILVEDNGAGMASEVLDRVFEPFFTTKPTGQGTGLGLPVSRGLVASLGGTLALESRPGEGTRAVVELPIAAPERAATPDRPCAAA
jgi:signal transduction histidine kinase